MCVTLFAFCAELQFINAKFLNAVFTQVQDNQIIISLNEELTIMALFGKNLKICQWDDSKKNHLFC